MAKRSTPEGESIAATAIMAKTTSCATKPSNLFWRQSAAKLLGSRPASSAVLSPSCSLTAFSYSSLVHSETFRSRCAILASLPTVDTVVLVYVAKPMAPVCQGASRRRQPFVKGITLGPFLAAEKY